MKVGLAVHSDNRKADASGLPQHGLRRQRRAVHAIHHKLSERPRLDDTILQALDGVLVKFGAEGEMIVNTP